MCGRHLYYSDWGENPRIVRTDLDGSNSIVIVNSTYVSNPNGLTLHNHHLFILDSNYNHRVNHAFLASFNMATQQWQEVEGATLSIPFGLAAQEGTVFYTDWLSTESSTGAVFMYDVQSGNSSVLIGDMANPTGIFYTKVKVTNTQKGTHL